MFNEGVWKWDLYFFTHALTIQVGAFVRIFSTLRETKHIWLGFHGEILMCILRPRSSFPVCRDIDFGNSELFR